MHNKRCWSAAERTYNPCMVDMEHSKRSSICIFCSRKFARSDALRRHWHSCSVRKAHSLSVPAVEQKTRGRKIRACDQCSQLKRACNSSQPCTQCVLRNQVCEYSRPRESSLHRAGESESHIDNINAFDTESDGMLKCHTDREVITGFDMHVYESVFRTLDHTNDHPETFTAELDHAIEPTLRSSRVDISSDIHASSCTSPGSLLIEHELVAPFCQHPTSLDINMLIQFPFLDNFTKTTGFVRSFGCGTKQQRLSITSDPTKASPSENVFAVKQVSLDAATHWIDIARYVLLKDGGDTDSSVALLPVTHEIVHRIRDVATTRHRPGSTHIAWSPSVEASCYEFFKPKSLRKCHALFWSCWYPNWPTIHAPTFRITEKAPGLIAAMALVGACLSPEERDRAPAQMWFDVVEDVIFSDGAFDDDDISTVWRDSTANHRRSTHLDVLQAAYCVCLYQTWEGSKRSKKRVLRQRFNDLVHLARDIGLDQASLKRIDTLHLAGFDWEEYILRESLIRICSYICNIDASYALFFRHVPRMVLSEMAIEMSSPETCFQASSRQECFVQLQAWRRNMGTDTTNLTILSAVNLLCDDAIMAVSTIRRAFAHLTVLNMFTIVHALYLQVHSIETSAIPVLDAARASSITNALRNWQQSWPSQSRDAELMDLLAKESDLSTMWQRLGFMRYAPEYWLMAYLTLKKIHTRNGIRTSSMPANTTSAGDCDMVEARRLINELKSETMVSMMDRDTI